MSNRRRRKNPAFSDRNLIELMRTELEDRMNRAKHRALDLYLRCDALRAEEPQDRITILLQAEVLRMMDSEAGAASREYDQLYHLLLTTGPPDDTEKNPAATDAEVVDLTGEPTE